MTEFITRNYGNENFEIIIKTDSKEHYKATENFARWLIDHAKPTFTIEAKPVVHAHWREWWPPQEFILTGEEKLYICSNCDAKYSDVENQRFCPWCGAQMDESISCSHENDKKGE